MKKVILLVLIAGTIWGQSLRPSIFNVSAGFVRGENTLNINPSYQYFVLGSYMFRSLDEISFAYKDFSQREQTKKYSEKFFAFNGMLNYFPFYLKLGYAGLQGNYSSVYADFNSKANIFSLSAEYYNHLFFYKLTETYADVTWQKRERISYTEGRIIYRPFLDFSLFAFSGLNVERRESPKYSFGGGVHGKFTNFSDFTAFWFKGKRRYYYDSDYMIFYSIPYDEQSAVSVFLDFYLTKNLSLTVNYEKHFFTEATAQFYSLTLNYSLVFKAE